MKKIKWTLAALIAAFALLFGFAACDGNDDGNKGNDGSIAVTSITLDKTTLALETGGAAVTLVATVAPADATNLSVTWTSSDTGVVTVSAAGSVSPVGGGAATITVASVSNPDVKATCAVTVTGISLNESTLEIVIGIDAILAALEHFELDYVDPFDIAELTASMVPADSSATFTWASSDTDVATVEASGSKVKVTAVAVGTATITVTSGTYSTTCEVTILATPDAEEHEFLFDLLERLEELGDDPPASVPADGILFNGSSWNVTATATGGTAAGPAENVDVDIFPPLDVREWKKVVVTFSSASHTEWWFGAIATDMFSGAGDAEWFEWADEPGDNPNNTYVGPHGQTVYEFPIEEVHYLDYMSFSGGWGTEATGWASQTCWPGVTQIKLVK